MYNRRLGQTVTSISFVRECEIRLVHWIFTVGSPIKNVLYKTCRRKFKIGFPVFQGRRNQACLTTEGDHFHHPLPPCVTRKLHDTYHMRKVEAFALRSVRVLYAFKRSVSIQLSICYGLYIMTEKTYLLPLIFVNKIKCNCNNFIYTSSCIIIYAYIQETKNAGTNTVKQSPSLCL